MTHPVAKDPHLVQAAHNPRIQFTALQRLQPLIKPPFSPTKAMAHQPFNKSAAVHTQGYGADLING